MNGPEGPMIPKQPITAEVQGEVKVLRAVMDRLGNIITPPSGYAQLRQIGKPNIPTAEQDLTNLLAELTHLQNNLSAAAIRLERGELLPELIEGNQPAIDLKYTDYTNLAKPPITTTPQLQIQSENPTLINK